MTRTKKYFIALTAASGIFMLLGWQLLLIGSTLSPLPFGAFPSIVFAAMMTSAPAAVVFGLICAALYAMVFVSLVFARKGKRWAMIAGTLCYCLDLAASLVFTAFSWWFLMGIALDILLIAGLSCMALTKK